MSYAHSTPAGRGPWNVFAVSGSLQAASSNSALVQLAVGLSSDDLIVQPYAGLDHLPYFNPDLDGDAPPQAVVDLRQHAARADAFLIASPEYAHEMPGALKNALDWLVRSGELYGKPAALLCAAPSAERGIYARRALQQTLNAQGVRIVASVTVPVPRSKWSPEDPPPAIEQAVAAALEALRPSHTLKDVLQGEYVPSTRDWVREQVEVYERSAGQEANTLRDTGLPIIVVTMRGNKTGNVRKIALMRVEHGGEYALVASRGGAPKHPVWYYNLLASPDEVTLQDGAEPFAVHVRELSGDERSAWWDRAVAAYPPYAEYQQRTQRQIPVFVASRADS